MVRLFRLALGPSSETQGQLIGERGKKLARRMVARFRFGLFFLAPQLNVPGSLG